MSTAESRKAATVLAVLLLAWIGSATASDPATEPAACSGMQVVEADAYVVPEGETVVLTAPTVIEARTIRIDGTLTTSDGSDGQAALSLCIQAESILISATGTLSTGDGQDAEPTFASHVSVGQDGTEGGDLTLILTDDSLTLEPPSLTIVPGGAMQTGQGGLGGVSLTSLLQLQCGEESTSQKQIPCPSDIDIPCTKRTQSQAAEGVCSPTSLVDTLCSFLGFTVSTEDDACVSLQCIQDTDCISTDCIAGLVGKDCSPTVCEPGASSSVGGDGADAGSLDLVLPDWPAVSLSVAPASISIGRGGDGGTAIAFGDLLGLSYAAGGSGGDSTVLVNGQDLSDPSIALLPFVTELLGTWLAESQGGAGGDSMASSVRACDLPPGWKNNPPPSEEEPCELSEYTQYPVYCLMLELGQDCQATFGDFCKAAFGDTGAPDSESGTDPPTGMPGDTGSSAYSGSADVSSEWECGPYLSFGVHGPDGGYGCSASVNCESEEGYPATNGDNAYWAGEEGGPATADGASSTGGFGALQGGRGGNSYAYGADGGIGYAGGGGGTGAALPEIHENMNCGSMTEYAYNGANGGYGSNGGKGGDASATGGRGGDSLVAGGQGGNGWAENGAPGEPGDGGDSGAGVQFKWCAPEHDYSTTYGCHHMPDTHDFAWRITWTKPGQPGCGGHGNVAGDFFARGGEGGDGLAASGPPGAFGGKRQTDNTHIRGEAGALNPNADYPGGNPNPDCPF